MNNIINLPKVKITGTINKWEVRNQNGNVVRASYTPTSNLITDTGLDMVSTTNTSGYRNYYSFRLLDYFSIGTGTRIPDPTIPRLEEEIIPPGGYRKTYSGGTSIDYCTPTGSNPFYVSRTRLVQTTVGDLNGTYSEFGFSPNNGINTDLFCLFRFTDSTSGEEISISVGSYEYLVLEYTLTIYLPVTNVIGTLTIADYGDVNYESGFQYVVSIDRVLQTLSPYVTSWEGKFTNVYNRNYTFSSIGNYGSWGVGNTGASITGTYETYISGSYEFFWEFTVPYGSARWSEGICSMSCYADNGWPHFWVVNFSTPIIKGELNTLDLKYKFIWGR